MMQRAVRAAVVASLLLLDLQNPYRYLEVRGTARIEPDDGFEFAGRVGAKYDADLAQYDAPGEDRVVVPAGHEEPSLFDEGHELAVVGDRVDVHGTCLVGDRFDVAVGGRARDEDRLTDGALQPRDELKQARLSCGTVVNGHGARVEAEER